MDTQYLAKKTIIVLFEFIIEIVLDDNSEQSSTDFDLMQFSWYKAIFY